MMDGKDLEGSGADLIEVISPHLPVGRKKNTKNLE
jgi:hypothetical protein